jgi:hypothetical protein
MTMGWVAWCGLKIHLLGEDVQDGPCEAGAGEHFEDDAHPVEGTTQFPHILSGGELRSM